MRFSDWAWDQLDQDIIRMNSKVDLLHTIILCHPKQIISITNNSLKAFINNKENRHVLLNFEFY